MIRWLWKIIVGEKPPTQPRQCPRDCQWDAGTRRLLFDADRIGVVDEWYVLRCKTCGEIKHHVIMRDGTLVR